MSPYNTSGNIRQQDIADRNHARQVIARMLAIEATRIAVMVKFLTDQLSSNTGSVPSTEAIWNDIQNSIQLTTVAKKTDANVADYPEFETWVTGRRAYIRRTQKRLIQAAVEPFEFRQRFANTKGLQVH